MLFSYGYGWQWNRWLQKMQANWWQFRSPYRRGDTVPCALPDGANPWLHEKPLDTAIRQVPAPYCPGGCHSWWFQMKPKKQLLPSFLTVDQRKQAKQFWDQKQTLYSHHWCNKLHTNGKPHHSSWRAQLHFWAIKRSQRTKNWKVINLERSPRKPVGHIWPYSN